jgi:hypothetical protein
MRQEPSIGEAALPFFEWRATTTTPYWMKLDGYDSFEELENFYRDQAKQMSQYIDKLEAEGDSMGAMNARQTQNKVLNLADKIQGIFQRLLNAEQDPNVLQQFE